MTESMKELVVRKLKVTFLTAFIFSTVWSFWETYMRIKSDGDYADFPGMFMIFFFYIFIIILIYGNLISIFFEFLQRKWFARSNWLYIFLLGLFGSVNGVLDFELFFMVFGILAALLYAIIDKWLLKSWALQESNKSFYILPLILFFLFWIYFNIT
ncbi:hypothetical protein BBI08_05125 [Planococcus halocryophilus]|uniref:Uncharacterized protein n=1 Tax=Planococcus halocryophilus TaxID=1215089 RepID=A0A1C7DNV0_9BACL|nr:hypothetical protein BBI08_05125 [Planococcus halocryophilus]